MDKVCNEEFDCDDRSDEHSCNLIDFGSQYTKQVPLDENGTLIVGVSVIIESITNIEEAISKIDVQLQLQIRWTDNRLKFTNLNDNYLLNIITDEEKAALWMPSLILNNTKSKTELRFDDDMAKGYVQLKKESKGKSTSASLSELFNFKTNAGRDGYLTMTKRISPRLTCSFQLQKYPFDSQECFIEVVNDKERFIYLDKVSIDFLGFDYVQQYMIHEVKFKQSTSKNAIVVSMILERQLLYIILTNLLPTILLTLVCTFCFGI